MEFATFLAYLPLAFFSHLLKLRQSLAAEVGKSLGKELSEGYWDKTQ